MMGAMDYPDGRLPMIIHVALRTALCTFTSDDGVVGSGWEAVFGILSH